MSKSSQTSNDVATRYDYNMVGKSSCKQSDWKMKTLTRHHLSNYIEINKQYRR
jgi:hypothetical protein